MSTTPDNAPSSQRITKRKLDDAISLLDSAVQEKGRPHPQPDTISMDDSASPPNAKRRALSVKSIYSTLSKYGFKGKDATANEKTASMRAPRLTALLDKSKTSLASSVSTTASTSSSPPHPPHPRPIVISSPQVLKSRPPARPTSASDFLARLGTFRLTTYRDKPRAVDAVYAARCGWRNDGVDRLVCESCSATWVVGSVAGMSHDAANTLTERQRVGMITSHRDNCSWRMQQCDESIYRVPLKGSTALAKDVKATAVQMSPVVGEVSLKHPLTTAQVAHLESTIASLPRPVSDSLDSPTLPPSPTQPDTKPSETALVLSLFGWALASSIPQPSSLTRKPSVIPTSITRSATISTNHHRTSSGGGLGSSRAPSVVSLTSANASVIHGRASRSPRPSSLDGGSSTGLPLARFMASDFSPPTSDAVLICSLCQRRVGLWGFTGSTTLLAGKASSLNSTARRTASGSSDNTMHSRVAEADSASGTTATAPVPSIHLQPRVLDVVKEHRSYCPYIVKSTPLPTFSFTLGGSTPPSLMNTGGGDVNMSGLGKHSTIAFGSRSPRVSGPSPPSSPSRPSSLPVKTGTGFSSPSLTTATDETLTEGWRAVLSVVGRAGMGRRRRKRSDRFGVEFSMVRDAVTEEDIAEANADGAGGSGSHDAVIRELEEGERAVDAMVDSVKKGNGNELLKYVKGLLG